MATFPQYPNPTDDPEFYCHGQACIDGGCSPLRCKDTPMDNDFEQYTADDPPPHINRHRSGPDQWPGV